MNVLGFVHPWDGSLLTVLAAEDGPEATLGHATDPTVGFALDRDQWEALGVLCAAVVGRMDAIGERHDGDD